MADALELEFDRGTLVCRSWPAGCDPAGLAGMRWDARVGCFRAPARCHARILERLDAERVPVADTAPRPFPTLPRVEAPDLRPYQAAALDAWRLAGRRGLVSLPTGSGKTHVALAAIAELRRGALCLVPTRILLEQWRRVLAAALRIEIGCYGDGVRELRPVTVATFESARRHMHHLGDRFELLVVDEAHHFGNGARDEALDMSMAPWRLGLSATPPDGPAAAGLAELVGPLVFELSIADLAGGYLADFELVELRLDLTPDERREYEAARADFAEVFERFRELAPAPQWIDFLRWAARTARGRQAAAAWRRARELLALTRAKNEMVGLLLARQRESRVLVFTSHQDAAYAIAREHLVMPITADIGRRERGEVLAMFREGRLRALVSARVLNEGFDLPAADVGIVLGGALGEREHVQRVGRLLRPAPEKRAIVYELVTRDTTEVAQARRRRRGLRSRGARAL